MIHIPFSPQRPSGELPMWEAIPLWIIAIGCIVALFWLAV